MNDYFTINTQGNFTLSARLFSSDENVNDRQNVAIVNCAMGRTKEYYAQFAHHLSKQGWTVVIYDYSGMGLSKNQQSQRVNIADWGLDTSSVIRWVKQKYPDHKVVIFGHSIGGQILGFLEQPELVDAVINVAAQKGYWRLWDSYRKYLLYGFWSTFPPLVRIYGRYPLMSVVGAEALPAGIAMDWYRWSRNSDYTSEDNESYEYLFARYTGPLLSISFTDDEIYAPKRAVDCLTDKFCNANITRWHISPNEIGIAAIKHSGFFVPCINIRFTQKLDEWLESVMKNTKYIKNTNETMND